MTLYRRQNDDESPIEDELLDDDGETVPITGFIDVEFHLWKQSDGTVVVDDDTDGNVEVPDAGAGEVTYDFADGDLSDTGAYWYEWQVTFSDGGIETFPNDRPGVVLIVTKEGA